VAWVGREEGLAFGTAFLRADGDCVLLAARSRDVEEKSWCFGKLFLAGGTMMLKS